VKTIKISVENTDAVQQAIKLYGEKAENYIAAVVKKAALEINRNVQSAIFGPPKTGHVYFRIPGEKYMTIRQGSADGPIVAVFRASGKQNLSLTHRSSAPGEAPANDVGTLASSLYYKQETKLSAEIGSRLPYAYWLEFGTTKIKPRPSWVPATENYAPEFRRLIEDALRRAAK